MGNGFYQWEVEGLNVERSNATLDELKHLSHLAALEIQIQDIKILPKGLFSKNPERYKIFIGDKWDWSREYKTPRMLKFKLNTGIFLEDGFISRFNGIEYLFPHGLKGVKMLYKI